MALTIDGSNGIILPVGSLTKPSLGTAGAGMHVPLANTLAFVTNTQSRIVIDSAGTVTVANNFVVSGNTTVSGTTIPTSKTLVTTIDSQTLTNKTISGANNTLSNIPNNSLSNNSIIFGATTQALGSTISGLNGVSLGQGTAAAGAFTTLSASSTVSGTGFSNYLASPPAIGGSSPAAGNFTSLGATGNVILGDASGDTLTINGTAVSCPNNLNFDSSTLLIDATNNRVGVGVANPPYKLSVADYSAGAPTVAALYGGAAGAVAGEGASLGLFYANGQELGRVSGQFNTTGTAADGKLVFYTRTAEAVTEKMVIDSSGNVGIGTNAPIRPVSVGTPNGGANAVINLGSGTSSLGTIEFADGITGDDRFRGYVQYAHADNSLRLGTDAAERLRIDSFGRVGIGLTNLSDATTNGLGVLGTLGVGVSGVPGYKAAVYSGTSLGLNYNLLLTPEFGGLGRDSAIIFGATFNNNWGGVDYSPRYAGAIQFGASNGVFGEPRAWAMRFLVGAGDIPVERMRINYNGVLTLGSAISLDPTTANALVVDVSGNVLIKGRIQSSSDVIGYAAGAGGTVTQQTSKSTGVTINKPSGSITLNNAELAAGATVSFPMTNSYFAVGDIIVFGWGGGGTGATISYNVWMGTTSNGIATICVKNISTGALSNPLAIDFAIIRHVTS
jgi:hypothetical protein